MMYESGYPNSQNKTRELCKPVNDFQRHLRVQNEISCQAGGFYVG